MIYKAFTRNVSRIVADHVKFYPHVFHLEFYYKNQVHGSHHVPSNVFHQSVIILTFHICIWNGLIFKVMSSLAYLNLQTKFESFSLVNS